MDKLILIKYGELTTKKDNRKFFINTLEKNIRSLIKDDIKSLKIEYVCILNVRMLMKLL